MDVVSDMVQSLYHSQRGSQTLLHLVHWSCKASNSAAVTFQTAAVKLQTLQQGRRPYYAWCTWSCEVSSSAAGTFQTATVKFQILQL